MTLLVGGIALLLFMLGHSSADAQALTLVRAEERYVSTSRIRDIVSTRVLACTRSDPGLELATGVFFGDAIRTGEQMRAAIDEYAGRFGAPPALVKTYHSFEDDFSEEGEAGELIRAVAGYPGVTSLLSLEPTWYGAPEAGLLEVIGSGGADERIQRFARGVAGVEGSLLVELAAEMNARFSAPWQAERNGSSAGPAAFIRAWRHTVDLARSSGADSVHWVFAPSAGNPYTHHPTGSSHWNWYGHWYPGETYVDFLGLHAFNHALDQGAWVPFVELVSGDAADTMLDDMTLRFPQHDVILGEIATSEHPDRPGAKAEWIADAYSRMRGCPNVAGIVWFDMNKEADWHISSGAAAAAAYEAAVRRDGQLETRLGRNNRGHVEDE